MRKVLSPFEIAVVMTGLRRVQAHLPAPVASPQSVKLMWEDSYETSGTLGSFHPFRNSGAVLLSTSLREVGDMVVPTACHELRHVQQYRNMGLLLFLLSSLPLLRHFTLEKSAWKVERACEKLLGMEGLNSDSIPWL